MTRQAEEQLRKACTADVDYVLDTIKEVLNPEEVFNEDQLEDWAEANGYVKEKSE